MKKLYDNEYGFSVEENNPFMIFPYLQKLAEKELPKDEIYDLSRGNPGLGFAPSRRGRDFFSFLMNVDQSLNSNTTLYRIHHKNENHFEEVMGMIKTHALEKYHEHVALNYLEILDRVLDRILECAKGEGREFTRMDALKGIFDYSTLAGGTYHCPQGELVARIVVADLYRRLFDDKDLKADDFVFTLGVNDAIGTIFQMFGEEGFGYLKKGDTVAISTPAYAPYFNEINSRGLKAVEIELDVITGKENLQKLREYEGEIKAFFTISPNNPAGLPYSKEAMIEIAEIAKKHNGVIVTDEIYGQFHKKFASIFPFAKERTIMLSGRSKIERSPGLRFGDVCICEEANEFLTDFFKEKGMLTASDFKTQFIWAKAPGGTFASFQHTAAVPGASQILGMLHVLLGEKSRGEYLDMIDENMDTFFSEIGLPRNDSIYYGIFDLNAIEGSKKKDVSIEQKLYELSTQKGIIMVPSKKFFTKESCAEVDKSNYVRVSLPNLQHDRVKEAAKRICDYLREE